MSNNKQSSVDKDFILYEEALALKELGFDKPCFAYYEDNNELTFGRLNDIGKKRYLQTPLYQQAFRWFRDKKLSDSYVYRYQDRTDGSMNYGYSIINDYGIEETRFIKENYITYEEAELACLRKLIEIVQGGNNEK